VGGETRRGAHRPLELFVTPEGLQRLLESKLPAVGAMESPDSRVAIARRAYDSIGLEWLSSSSIRVLIFEEGTRAVATTARLDREGPRWRVVDVEIPVLGLEYQSLPDVAPIIRIRLNWEKPSRPELKSGSRSGATVRS